MRFGVYVPTFGEYDVGALAELAREAEGAGWDGFFIWDHLAWTPDGEQDLADTTVALTAIALATERLRFGALVTPLVRRRPWKLAKEAASLDRLSNGRLVVGTAGRHSALRRRRSAGGASRPARRGPGSSRVALERPALHLRG